MSSLLVEHCGLDSRFCLSNAKLFFREIQEEKLLQETEVLSKMGRLIKPALQTSEPTEKQQGDALVVLHYLSQCNFSSVPTEEWNALVSACSQAPKLTDAARELMLNAIHKSEVAEGEKGKENRESFLQNHRDFLLPYILQQLPHDDSKKHLASMLSIVTLDELESLLEEKYYPSKTLEERKEINQFLEEVSKDQRYGTLTLIKDVVLPWLDVALDIVQLYTFYVKCRYQYMCLVFGGMCLNGIATCILAERHGEYGTAVLNLLTFGTAGLGKEAFNSWQTKIRSPQLVWYKTWETVESSLSFAAGGYDLLVAGNISSIPPLDEWTLAIRYFCICLSLFCIPLTAFDVAARSVFMMSDYAHLRNSMRTVSTRLALLLFHFFELCGQFVVVFLFAFCTRPFGVFCYMALLAICNLVMVLDVSQCRGIQAGDIPFLILSNLMNFTYASERRFQTISLYLIVQRIAGWTVAWVFVIRAGDSWEVFLEDKTFPLTFLAVVGYFGFIAMAIQQRRWGRFQNARTSAIPCCDDALFQGCAEPCLSCCCPCCP